VKQHITTKEELYNNYQFKITKRALKQQYPFIKDVILSNEESLEKYQFTLFLTLVIDPYLLEEYTGLPIWGAVYRSLKRGNEFKTSLPVLFSDWDNPKVLELKDEIVKTMNAIAQSTVLPDAFKIDKRSVSIDEVIVPVSLYRGHGEEKP
jgi:hypothetical protein